MTSTEEQSSRGRKNIRAGSRAMARAVTWCREHGAPDADKTSRNHCNDLTNIGRLAVEVTVTTWDKMGMKADQAAKDAAARGLTSWAIWKPRKGVGDMGRAWCLTEVGQWWALNRELTELRAEAAVLRDLIRIEYPQQEEAKI